MTALNCIEKILNTSLPLDSLRFCLVDDKKVPYKTNGELARPNQPSDFCGLEELCQADLQKFAGIGISIQASKIFAIDVDHCFSRDGRIILRDERAKEILNRFEDIAYCEFSFSGTGLRILFDADLIDNYSSKYYIKNEKTQIEFYQPTNSFRYVTLTGNTLYDNFSKVDFDTISAFLEKYMKRPVRVKRKVEEVEDASIEVLKNRVKMLYLTNYDFQDLWFGKAPGSGKDESERDYHILSYLYEKITREEEKIKELFESSPYFKSKDRKHIKKWEQQDFRYFKYVIGRIREDI